MASKSSALFLTPTLTPRGEHVRFRVLRHFFRHVRIAERALRCLDVLRSRGQVRRGVLETALDCADRRLLIQGFLDRVVEHVDRSVRVLLRADVQCRAVLDRKSVV